ncbi:uncharacterized protein LOC133179892 [Saccostrea echinata]|uniref:uncharacterized protein LOC133179892 n=1 Tax=Saccostrea echinata TaxID=191078 RepID=UPI002A83178B|nr:uncharacterized protein LOC133179892 [Saccostrea echinata]
MHYVQSSNAVGKRLRRCDYPPRRGSTGYSDAELERKIKDMLQSSPPTVGYRHMTDKLRHLNIPVRRDKVMEIMRRIDPLGVDFRRRRRIKRKIYYSQGPNYIWHVDGYDKLKPFGFPIHGCIDGFSRRIMWLEVGPSNNDPEIVACNFVQTVATLRGCPRILQSDPGTENITMGALQCLYRNPEQDQSTARGCYRVTRSVFNQRIEAWWSMMRRQEMEWLISFFKELETDGFFRKDVINDVYSLRFCFMPVLQNVLDAVKEQWNNHPIAYNRHSACPHGRPNVLYILPEEKGFSDCIQPVSEEDINFSQLQCKVPTRSGFLEFDNCSNALFGRKGWSDATPWQEALEQYFELVANNMN